MFQRMASEVQARETRLQQQVRDLQIVIDEERQAKRVAEITESDYFQRLRGQADDLRRIWSSADSAPARFGTRPARGPARG
jgi:hypothetical protein